MSGASLAIRWFENGEHDFHYRERHDVDEPSAWQYRWDDYPNPHAVYAHFHRPPDADAGAAIEDPTAVTRPENAFGRMLANVRDRIESLWE